MFGRRGDISYDRFQYKAIGINWASFHKNHGACLLTGDFFWGELGPASEVEAEAVVSLVFFGSDEKRRQLRLRHFYEWFNTFI